MKKFLILCVALFTTTAIAHTVNWHDLNQTTQTTCNVGDNITPPTPVGKYGYHVKEWIEAIPIEYIESTGTQYIDTGIIVNSQNTKFVTRVKNLATDSGILFGFLETVNGYPGVIVNTRGMFRYGNSSVGTISPELNTTIIYNLELSWKKLVVNGTTYTTESATVWGGQNTRPLYIFARDELNGSANFSKTRLYSFKIYDNNSLVRDFVPVLDKNSVACLYDKVSNTFFYNAGTGNFIAGPMVGE